MAQRFYVVSEEGDGYALAWRLKQEGYEVVVRCKDLFMRQNLDGVVDKTTSRPRASDIIVFDGVGSGALADSLREQGYGVVGGSVLADQLEIDRVLADETWRGLEIQTPESKSFDSFSEAISFVGNNKGRWVFKPAGDIDCAFTYCATDELDMVSILLHFQSVGGDKADFMLQRFVGGVCVSTEGWFDGEEWIEGAWNSTIEVKGLCVGDLGPKTGCSWCVVWPYAEIPRIAREVHSKLTPMLAEANYVGPWDMNCVINSEGIYVLEATPRFGYDAIEAYAALMQCKLGEMLEKLVDGDTHLWPIAQDEIAASLRVAIAPYPFGSSDHPASGDLPVRYRHEDENYLWLTGVRQHKRQLLSSPTDGTIGVVTASGDAERNYEVFVALRQRARRLMIPNCYWRDDVGDSVQMQWMQLGELGYETPTSHSPAMAMPVEAARVS